MGNVLITGTSTGIGEASAIDLAAKGHRVFAGVRKEADGQRLVASGAPGRITPIVLDVTDDAAIEAASKTIDAEVGGAGLHGLVNNAGVARGGPLEYLPIEEWREQLEVNVIGQVAVTKAMLPFIRRATGRIVFVGSAGGRMSTPLMAPYGASKFALEGICESLRHELRPWGIKVVLVEPGAIKTAIWQKGRDYAVELEQRLGREAVERYREFVDAVLRGIDMQDRRGAPPSTVAKVIDKALFSPRPRARYPVGVDAYASAVLQRTLPDSAKDFLIRKIAGP